jgi:hypothetical protein
MSIPSFIASSIKLSIPVNGVLVRMDRIIGALRRYCHPVIFHNGDTPLELSQGGSSLLFSYQGKKYLLCTKHQIANLGRNPADAIIISREAGVSKAHSPGEAHWIQVKGEGQKNLEDVLLIDYSAHDFQHDLTVSFLHLDLSKNLNTIPAKDIRLIFAVAYLASSTDYEPQYEEHDLAGLNMTSRWSKIYLEQSAAHLMDTENRIAMVVHPDAPNNLMDMDGASGAPVFFVYQDKYDNAYLGFAGIITHANSSGRFMIYDAAIIKKIADQAFEE